MIRETMTDRDVAYLKPLWHREYGPDIGLRPVPFSNYDITSGIVLPYLMRRIGWSEVYRDPESDLLVIVPTAASEDGKAWCGSPLLSGRVANNKPTPHHPGAA